MTCAHVAWNIVRPDVALQGTPVLEKSEEPYDEPLRTGWQVLA